MAATTQPTSDPIAAELEQNGTAQRTLEELPEHLYHARPEYSTSMLKLLPDDPEMFYGRHVLKLPEFQFQPTRFTDLGTAGHAMILQGTPPPIIPADVLSKTGARQGNAWKDFADEHAGEVWLKESEAEPLKWMVESLKKTKKARALLDIPGLTEQSMFWTFDNLRLRGRLDRLIVNGDSAMVLDLKLTSNASPEKFFFHAEDMGYHYQAAAYMWAVREVLGIEPSGFIFIVGEYQVPYRWFTYKATESFIETGWLRLREAIAVMKERTESDNWLREDRDLLIPLSISEKRNYHAF
jgi:exodeoxyribonuclease VIII